MDLTQDAWRSQLLNDTNSVIIDVRTEIEREEGYIPNAMHLDIYDSAAFVNAAKELDNSKNYYVYCRSGGRSAQACMIFKSVGIENTYNLMGGFSEWNGDIEKPF
jgi:rhodanese-related sulfurtransferase